MRKNKTKTPDDLHYSQEHEWARIKSGDEIIMGITDYAQNSLHEVVYVELPKKGSKVNQMEPIGTVESIKSVSDIFSPLSGEITEVNEKLTDSPELVNQSPYDEGWIAIIKPKALDKELKILMTAKKYAEYVDKLTEK